MIKEKEKMFDSVSITTEQMEVIKHVLNHAFESLTPNKGPNPTPNQFNHWETSEYSDRLKLTQDEFTDLCRVLRIIC
jgi:hypothetical protein